MEWSEVIDNPYLKDLPFKIELNEYGSIVMTPASNRHALRQGDIARLLGQHAPEGKVAGECSIQTSKGVKVPDVAWLSGAFFVRHELETPFTVAPEICVEVLSPSNSRAEIEEKRRLYFEAGAQEVWFCHDDGRLEFASPAGELPASALAPTFPITIA